MGTAREHTYIWHVSNIRRDWAGAFILPAGARSPVLAFKSSSTTSQPQKTHALPRNGSATHLSTKQANPACLCKKINCWRSQMTATWKVCLRQQLCRCSGLKSWQNTLRSPQQHWKPCCHFRHPICVKQGFLQWQQPKQTYGADRT